MPHSDTAIAYSNVAEAALYFEHVIPISIFFDHTFRLVRSGNPFPTDDLRAPAPFLRSLLPLSVRHDERFLSELRRLYVDGSETLIAWMDLVRQKTITVPALTGFGPWLEDAGRISKQFGFDTCPVVIHPNVLPQLTSGSDIEPDFGATMTSLHLIDADAISWAQVEAFRKDTVARSKLRRLRLFFIENYTGRDRRYVEDDLYRRIEDYDQVVRDWGFETRCQAISMFLSSKWLAAAASGSFISALTGSPITAIITAASGVAIEIGRFSLELSKQRHAIRKAARDNPLSYILDVQSAGQNNT